MSEALSVADLEIDLDSVDEEEHDHDEHEHSVAPIEGVRQEPLQHNTYTPVRPNNQVSSFVGTLIS